MLLPDDQDVKRPRPTAKRRPIIVQKYGGSSVADTDKLGRVADRIVATRRAGHDVVAVVSAMGKTTDQLLTLAREVASDAAAGAEAPRRELDMLVSTGERVAMSLLSIAIQSRGEDAISFTGSQCGIITNDRHFDAKIIEVRPHRIEDELARGRIVIVAGYQGMSYRREITTLGRGGTDTTAVALAAALSAERCEIYSDVDGVYSADPRCVADASHLPEVDYDMLQEMAESGAKVLCARAVEWARDNNVALYARASHDDSAAPKQTIVRKGGPEPRRRPRAVTCDPAVATLSLSASVTRLGHLLGEAGLRPREVTGDDERAQAIVSLTSVPDWRERRRELEAQGFVVTDGRAMVSVVGSGLTEDAATVAEFRGALADAGIPLLALSATQLRISAVIDSGRHDEAQRALHAAFL